MKILCVRASLLSLLMLATTRAEVVMTLAVDKTFYQRNAFNLDFRQGRLRLEIRDGNFLFLPCLGQPSPRVIFPNIACPAGTTGFIATGDIDGDGFRDDNQYWSMDSVIEAVIIEPARPDLATLFSAPPSKLPRPLPAFIDDSVVVFFNIFQTNMEQLDITRYYLTIPYGAVPQVETTNTLGGITTGGNLNVVITGSDIAGSPLSVPVPVLAGDDGFAVAASIRAALDATAAVTNFYSVGGDGSNISLTELIANGNDPGLNIGVFAGTAVGLGLPIPVSLNTTIGSFKTPAAASKQMREELVEGTYTFLFPRLNDPEGIPVAISTTIAPMIEALERGTRSKTGFRITSGKWDDDFYQIDPRLIHVIKWTGNDLSNILRGDEIYFSILSPDETFITFPPLDTQLPIQLPTPTQQEYTIPPFFYAVGDEGVIHFNFERTLRTTGIAFDTSERTFNAKVRMVDSYDGFAQFYFELGTPVNLYPAAADKDRDGMSNIDEFGLEFPTLELLQTLDLDSGALGFGGPAANEATKKPAAPAPTLAADNHIEMRASVRPLSGTSLKYTFLQTTTASNGKTKTKSLKSGRDWTITTVTENEQLVVRGVPIPGVFVDREYVVLRSTRPVADPLAPLPIISVAVAPLPL